MTATERTPSSFATEHAPCNLCGSTRLDVAYQMPDEAFHPDEWFTVVACRDCGLGFVNPRPPLALMERYYPAVFYDNSFENDDERHRARYAREAEIVNRHTRSTRRRLLDVGCANGAFPRYMRAIGWDVEGLEVSKQSNPIADFPLHSVHFPDLELEVGRFDAITAWAVLEHVHDPMAHFANASKLLHAGGVFVFLVTNFDSVNSRHLFQEDVPRHLVFFTESCVRRYLAETGFVLEESIYSNDIFGMDSSRWLAYYVARARGRAYTWEDARMSRTKFFRDRGLKDTRINTLRYAAQMPLFSLGSALLPFHRRLEILRKRYGIVTYVARRSA